MKENNYYDTLELETNCTQEQIRVNYNRIKNTYSKSNPASYSLISEDKAKSILDELEIAYIILSDPVKRIEYNNAHNIENVFDNKIEEGRDKEKQERENKILKRDYFFLDYKVDPDFEVEIEKTTEFTGSLLKKIREYKNVTIERVSETTKITSQHIINLEEENYNALPAKIYTRGFVYQYARILRLNPTLVANSYISRYKKQ